MKIANIAEFKNNLSSFMSDVESGEEVTVCKHNRPVARVVPAFEESKANKTQLNCGKGSALIFAPLTEPLISDNSWDMCQQ